MVETAFTYIAESVVKAVGVAGVEAMAMHKAIMMVWSPLANAFSDELLEAVITEEGHVRPERAELIMARHKSKLTYDFIEEVADSIEEYAGHSYDRGKEFILSDAISGVLEVQKQTEAVIEDLVRITGSTKANVQRTIKRWFKETQGQYFDRFIVPETSRLLSYADEAEGNIATLRSIGQNYKKFVEADAYWSSVSEFNAESSKIWSEVQTLHEIGVDTYTIVAIIDKKTCPVCIHLNGTTWSVQQAVSKVYEMLIMESDAAYEQNPFPPRSTPKDYPDPQESPFDLPPFHPRCRCNIRSTHAVSMMPQDIVARPFSVEKPPTNRLLSGVFNTYVTRAVEADITTAGGRVLTGAEFKTAKKAFNDIPYELRKWASRNKTGYKIYAVEGEATSQVIGDAIEINAKYFKSGPEVLQHELRHALINKEVIQARGGAEPLWNTLQEADFKMPTHVNAMYQANGGRGFVAARAAVDEFLALIGDYYTEGISFDELVAWTRSKEFGIRIAKKAGQITIEGSTLWTAREAKKAVEMWWHLMDIDNFTLMTEKQLISKLNQVPFNVAKMHIATTNELRLRDILRNAGINKVFQEGDRKPFDVWIGADPYAYYTGASKAKPRQVIEVKSIIEAKNDKITMPKDALFRKNEELKVFTRAKAHTVVFDERTGKIYYKEGLGSFRLSSMQEVSEAELQKIFGGTPQVSEYTASQAAETITYKEITTAKAFDEFRKNMELVKPEHKLFLDWFSWEEYKEQGIRLFMDKDGYTGFGLTKDNMLVTLWSRADAPRGIGKRSIAEAIRQGCVKLECFDGKLPKIYGEFGFKEVARYPWNAEYAPEGWLVEKFGTPDYLEMELRTELRAARSTERLSEIRSASKVRVVEEGTLTEKGSISNGNINEVKIVTIGAGKKKYIFKPVAGESFYGPDLKYTLQDLGVSSISEITPSMLESRGYYSVGDILRENLVRYTIDNTDVPLAVREAFALDVAERLGLNNEFAIIPKHMLVTDEEGNVVGVLIEHISKAFDGGMWKDFNNARSLGPEESFQMSVFDYLIGNTDRHHNNWMRKYKRLESTGQTALEGSTSPRYKTLIEKNPVGDGRPIYIDHGYTMPSQSMDLGGLSEWRAMEAAERWVDMEMEYDFDPEWYEGLIKRIQKFVDEEAEDLARAYGFSHDEIDAMLRRGDALLERLRGGTFSEMLVQHEDNGLWGLQDDFIE